MPWAPPAIQRPTISTTPAFVSPASQAYTAIWVPFQGWSWKCWMGRGNFVQTLTSVQANRACTGHA